MIQLYPRVHNTANHFKKHFLWISLLLFAMLYTGIRTNAQMTQIPGLITSNPTVTINQSAAQVDPTNLSPINFTVLFDQPVNGFATGDVTISGTAGGLGAVVTGGPTLFNVSVFGMTSCGTVIVNIPAGVCTNALFEPNLASTSVDNTVTYIPLVNPNVTINQSATQPDPTSVSPINFTVVFDQVVTGFATGDVTLSGTAGATTGIVTGSGTTYNVEVSGMTASGSVIATIAAGVSQNACTQPNNASTSTDNTVIITCVPPVVNVSPATSCGGVPGIGGPCNALTASGNADTYVWSPLVGLYTDCAHTTPYTGTNTTLVYAAPTAYTVYTVTGTITASGCSNTATARVNYTPSAPVVTPNPAVMCLGDPPVKLKVIPGATAQFCSGPVNIAVPDNNPTGVSNSINVSGIPAGCLITNIAVTINMPHTDPGDMVINLRGPNGQILSLYKHNSNSNTGLGSIPTAGFYNAVVSSIGVTPFPAVPIPYRYGQTSPAGPYRADALNGVTNPDYTIMDPTGFVSNAQSFQDLYTTSASANGNWTLAMADGAAGDLGTLISWCLDITYACGPASAGTAVWSPYVGLFLNQAATIPYIAGTAIDSVWARPTPAGVYPYQVTRQSLPTALCSPATNFVNTNGSATVTFNLKNNHPYPIVLSQIDSRTLIGGNAWISAFYKTNSIAGLPGAISPANGWNQFAAAVIAGTGTAVQPFLRNLQFAIPPGVTYAICIQAITATNASNLAYSALSPGNYSFNDGGCEIITGTNIGYSGTNVPAAPTTTLSGFIGKLYFLEALATCTSPPTTVVVTVGGIPISITAQPVNKTICTDGVATFSVTATGGGTLSYQWQVSNNGSTYTNIANGGVYSGATTAMLTVTAPPVSMSGYYYRVLINGTTACAATTSMAAILTVNPLPAIVITANPLIIGPTQITTIFSTVTPNPALSYTWYYNNSVVPGAVSSSLLVNYGSPGDYQLQVTDVNGCSNLSNIISIANSFALNMFTYPNPSGGIFEVRYYSEPNNTLQRSFIVYNNQGEKIITRNFTQTIPYQKIDVDVRANGKGLYWIELRDAAGKRLAISRVVVQ